MINRPFFLNTMQYYHEGQLKKCSVGPMFKVHEYQSEDDCIRAAIAWRKNLGETTSGIIMETAAPITGFTLSRHSYGE